MRPIQLKMTAFGPYKGTETVDFRELKDNRLFVISGATGAGKTTIFDGICFALYGQASGEDRTDFRAMRSDFAEDEVQTEVELTFEIHHRVYRILRQIPYVKSGNKTETAGRCEFYEQVENESIPIVDRQIVTEIDKKVEELMGLSQTQFSQIVMLPQGEFRKFLTSNTENKESIMRKIFKTEPYREVVSRLKEKKDELYAEVTSEKQLNMGFMKQIPSVLPERDSTIFSVLSNEHYNANQVVQALEEELRFYQEKTVLDKKNYESAYQKHEEMLRSYHAAQSVNERFVELEQREVSLAALSEQIPFMEKEEKRLARAERASRIEEIENQFILLKKEVMDKEENLVAAVEKVRTDEEKMKEVELLYQIERNREGEREALTEKWIRLNDYLPKVTELDSKKEILQGLEAKVEKVENERIQMIENVSIESEKVDALQKKIDDLEAKLIPFDDQMERLNEISETVRLADEGFLILKQLKQYENMKNASEAQYEQSKENYQKAEHDWLNSQAAHLAAELHEGDACPVCGSVNHPAKLEGHLGEIVTKAQLESVRDELSAIESAYRLAAANYQSAFEQFEIKEEGLRSYGIERESLEEKMNELHVKKKELEEELSILREQKILLVESKEKWQKQNQKTEELKQQKSAMDLSVLESSSMLKTEQSLFDATFNSIPKDIRALAVLRERILELSAKKSELNRAWEEIQKSREKSREMWTAAQTAEIHAKQSLVESKEKQMSVEHRFKEILQTSEFENFEAYAEAKMIEEQRNILREKLTSFQQQLHTIRVAIAELKAILEGKEKVELVGMEAAIGELKIKYEQAFADYNASLEYERNGSGLIEKIKKSSVRLAEVEGKHNKVTSLYDVVRGQNEEKLSFERYIQIEYLERIIQLANERLKEMANGQFILMRSERQEGRGRQSGLGLDVYDVYTGQNRDVKTLSGGEKFNASLCLALGMADVIQSFQGSVSIDTMFIDEGFGSLDEESLNKAIDTLIDLQKSGRMIGVISHVEELKAAFPAILEVTKSREGYSHTSFLLK